MFVCVIQEEQLTFLSPAEDESSREVFSLINKVNVAALKTKPTLGTSLPTFAFLEINLSFDNHDQKEQKSLTTKKECFAACLVTQFL